MSDFITPLNAILKRFGNIPSLAYTYDIIYCEYPCSPAHSYEKVTLAMYNMHLCATL